MTDEVKRRGRPRNADRKLKVMLLRDYWPEEDERLVKGQIVELPYETAVDLVNDRKAELVK